MHQGSVLSPFPFAVVVDIITEFASEGAPSELQYADDLVLMSETIEGLRDMFLKWWGAFGRKCLQVNLGKTRIMVSSSITQDAILLLLVFHLAPVGDHIALE